MAADLDSLLAQYRRDPNRLDALLSAATGYATSVARNLGHPDPEDVAQRVAMHLWRSNQKIESSVRYWLTTITRRICAKDARTRAEHLGTGSMPTADVPIPEEHRPCRNILSLGDRRLQKVAAMLVMGYSVQEASSTVQVSVRTVHRIVANHRKQVSA